MKNSLLDVIPAKAGIHLPSTLLDSRFRGNDIQFMTSHPPNAPKDLWSSLIRSQIEGFEPYLPGRSMESVKKERGLKRVFKLASNENALGPSPRALAAMKKASRSFFRYPDGGSTALRAALAAQAKVPASQVIIGAGSDEIIEILGKTFLNPGDSIVVSDHAFIRYRMAAELMGADVVTVPMRDYTHDLDAMAAAVRDDTKIVFIANPNNPTGTYNTQSQLTAFLEVIRQKNALRDQPVLVVVDEAYYEYSKALAADYPDTLRLRATHPELMVMRTFSKAHALAGLRIGYAYAEPTVIQALDRARPPFNVSTAGQAAAEASLGDRTHIQKGIRLVQTERKTVLPALKRLGLPFIPSIANFVLIDVSPRRGADVFESLLNRGIIVRSMDEYGFPHHIRVTYGLPRENREFLKCLQEVLAA